MNDEEEQGAVGAGIAAILFLLIVVFGIAWVFVQLAQAFLRWRGYPGYG